ncbi:MAG: MotA/TolQ/ExbB proton channel family protein [Spirochaetaceae bacterium]|jgi:chemotaxis protein MotA|nr:MotA/TolQ/ExbB proton channel family protein [Spirochaetaceae bacterium]
MDISTVVGLVGALGMIVMTILTSGGSVVAFADLPSFLIVVAGSFFSVMTAVSISEAIGMFKVLGLTFQVPNYDMAGIIKKLMAFADKARREGLLALEEELEDLDNEFMKKGLRLVVDGTDAAIVRGLLEIEMSQVDGRHGAKVTVMNMWATLAPSFGMMGTVVGLVAMMRNLDDKAAVGPNMAVALITTMYGSLVANVMLLPLGTKLKTQNVKECTVMEMVLEGILSIQAGDNPRILAMKLLSYLDPPTRKGIEAEVLKD